MNIDPRHIRVSIDSNNAKIEQILTKESFVLNEEIVKLMNENETLRASCEHEYDINGICIYCLSQYE